MRLGVLGGSFDPPHNAHLILARLALEQLGLEQVTFVVAASQPHKHGEHHATAEQRLRMVALALDGLIDFTADGRELRRPGPSYTVDTLRELHAAQPDLDVTLLLGADAAHGFATWRDPDGIRALARVAVCHRHGDAPPAGFDATITMPAVDISSTAIRARVGAGRSIAGWVPRQVADYIVASNLYGSRSG